MSKRIAVVTGGHKGLGFEISRRLAGIPDVKVILSARRNEDALTATKRFAASGIHVDCAELDVTNPTSVETFAQWLRKSHGRLDILINNAGVNPYLDPNEASILTSLPETLIDSVSANAGGMLRITQALIPLMKESHGGRIVNVSTEMASLSQMGKDFYPPAPSYRASKSVMNVLTVLLAKELQSTGILVNAYSPGWMRTDMGGKDAPFSVEEGAETAIFLAQLPDGGPTGRFYAEMRKFGGPMELQW